MKKPIRILSIDNSFTFGGAIISLYHMLRAVDKACVEPTVVSGQPLAYLEEKFPGCRCYHFIPKLTWVDNRKFLALSSLWFFRSSQILMKCLNLGRLVFWLLFINLPEGFRYYRIGRRNRVELVHLNNGHLQISGIIAAKLLRVPIVSHLRGFNEPNFFSCFVARFIDQHIAISEAIRDNLRQHGLPDERITLVHDAISLEEFDAEIDCTHLRQEFNLAPGQLSYGLFGRIVPWKGVREFVMMARQVSEEYPDARGFVVGDASDGDEEFFDEMQLLAHENGLDGKLVFTGYRPDVPAMMKMMDVIVHSSSLPEPFGMVIIEGMAMGKPVVATRAGGPLDIVEEGQTGFMAEIANSEALAEPVCRLIGDPALCRSMGQRGRERVEKLFSNQLYAKKMTSVFEQLVSGVKSVTPAVQQI